MEQFPFARIISEENANGSAMESSCKGRCEAENYTERWQCMCDNICLFLGDCCYDYLMTCDSRKLNFTSSLEGQSNIYQQHVRESSCVPLKSKDERLARPIRMVDKCPVYTDVKFEKSLCSTKEDSTTITSYIPVIHQGILYQNIYCAVCHRIRLRDVNFVTDAYNTIFGESKKFKTIFPWIYFDFNFTSVDIEQNIMDAYKFMIKRLTDACCSSVISDQCSDNKYLEECRAYRKVTKITYKGVSVKVKNRACGACIGVPNTNELPLKCNSYLLEQPITGGTHFNLFRFVKSASPVAGCSKIFSFGQPGSNCLVKKCQPGFELHDEQCINQNDSLRCLPPSENLYSPDYDIADFLYPVVVVFVKQAELLKYERRGGNELTGKLLRHSEPCSLITEKVYLNFITGSLPGNTHCRLLYSSTMAFSSIVNDMETTQFYQSLSPGFSTQTVIAINHDPVSGLKCSGEIGIEALTHEINGSMKCPQYKTRNHDRIFSSWADPLIVISGTNKLKSQTLALYCKLDKNKAGCNIDANNTYSVYDTCPKYELTHVPSFWDNSVTPRTDKTVLDFMLLDNGHVLVCADMYDQMYSLRQPIAMHITIMISNSISLVCLAATFFIHIRYRALRTLPGLMLMNLIVALFLAQLLYMMTSSGVFKGRHVLCQTLAAAQHYFWLASFAWMACMSLDIFICLSSQCTTVKTYTAAKYSRYLLAGWLAPLSIPVLTFLLSNFAVDGFGYGFEYCWLEGTEAVLYLFAIPVLSVVTLNIILFVSSVFRLGILLQNAAFVGRKEDNKQRLIQCIKLSSWMGISWLFGIIPNFVDIEALWYLFAIGNAFQGVHIFLAFGMTGKARVLMSTRKLQNRSVSTMLSTSLPSISGNVDVQWENGV